jgi:hypothetical protein
MTDFRKTHEEERRKNLRMKFEKGRRKEEKEGKLRGLL